MIAPAVRRTVDFYRDPLIYDVLHASGTRPEAAALRRILRRHVGIAPRASTWLEPACGTARVLRLAAREGVRVLGFDRSRAMGAYARARLREQASAPGWMIRQCDMASCAGVFGRARAHLAFNLINTIRHLDSDQAMLDHFRGMRTLLAPGGVYAVGISLSAYGLEGPSEDVWSGRRAGLRVSQVVNFLPPTIAPEVRRRAERVLSHMLVRRDGLERHLDSTYTLRTYSLDQWQSLIREAGWRVLQVVDQDSSPTAPVEPGYAVWVLAP